MVFMPLLHNKYVEFGSFRKFMGFSASHAYIFDNKRSEIFTCSVTSFPADVCNAGLGLLFLILLQDFVFHIMLGYIFVYNQGHPMRKFLLAKYLKYYFLLYKICSNFLAEYLGRRKC